MDVTFRTNATGSWGDIGTNSSVYNGTYQQASSDMDSYNATYWWSVNLTDGTLWVNETYSFNTSLFYSVNITAITEDGYIANNTGGASYTRFDDETAFRFGYLDMTDVCYRAYVEWDTSSLPDTATIIDTVFIYHGKDDEADGHIHDINNQPSAQPDTDAGNRVVYDDCGDGTEFANPAGYPVASTGQEVDLGTAADADLEGNLTDDWWGIGMQSDGEIFGETPSSIYSEEYGSVNPIPTIRVNYTISS